MLRARRLNQLANTILAILVPLLAVTWAQMWLSEDWGSWDTVIMASIQIVALALIWRPWRWSRRTNP